MSPRTRLAVASTLVLALGGAAAVVLASGPPRAADPVARGRYLVRAMGCSDCHAPWRVGPDGRPGPDMSRGLSGHPESLVLPPPPDNGPGPWVMTAAATNTAWAGPWGISYTANLTPDDETGIGRWTTENFIQALRTQRHMGRGRPLLPPMPAAVFANLNDEDLTAIFSYLKSEKPVRNRVPEPLPPAGQAEGS